MEKNETTDKTLKLTSAPGLGRVLVTSQVEDTVRLAAVGAHLVVHERHDIRADGGATQQQTQQCNNNVRGQS